MLATALGSSPSIANIIKLLVDTIISGFVYDTIKCLFERENGECMKKMILILGLGWCGDMV